MSTITTLRERISSYENLSNHTLMNGLPKIIIINGRNFRKCTSLLQKPFSEDFLELMAGTTIKLMSEIEGAKFCYSFNDLIIIGINSSVMEEQWYDGDTQKISSTTSAIATYEFNKLATEKKVEFFGDAIFSAHSFAIPNITELTNVFIMQQQSAFHINLSLACFYALTKKFDAETVRQTLLNKSPQEKAELLFESCGIDYNVYSLPFRRGFATYRVPKVISEEIRNKLTLNFELPLFTKERDFLDKVLNEKTIIRK